MAISISQSLDLKSKQPNFTRDIVQSKSELNSEAAANYYVKGMLVYCIDDDTYYKCTGTSFVKAFDAAGSSNSTPGIVLEIPNAAETLSTFVFDDDGIKLGTEGSTVMDLGTNTKAKLGTQYLADITFSDFETAIKNNAVYLKLDSIVGSTDNPYLNLGNCSLHPLDVTVDPNNWDGNDRITFTCKLKNLTYYTDQSTIVKNVNVFLKGSIGTQAGGNKLTKIKLDRSEYIAENESFVKVSV